MTGNDSIILEFGKFLNPGKMSSLKDPNILYIKLITPKALSFPNKWVPVQISTKMHAVDQISNEVE